MKTTLFTTTILLLLLSLLLIPKLNDKSIWGDEGWSIRFTDGDSLRDVFIELSHDRHPPLYFFVLHGWRQIAGDEEIALRLMAVFAALLTGAMLYRLGKTLFGVEAGIFALLLFTLLDKQIVFSQEVRHYTWLMFFAVWSSWALVKWLKNPRFLRGLILVVSVIGGLYTHSLYMLVLLGQIIFAGVIITTDAMYGRPVGTSHRVSATQKLIKLGSLYFLAFIAYLPGLALFYYQYLQQGNISHTIPINWESVELLAPEFFGKPMVMMVGLLLLGLASPILKNKQHRQAVFLPFLGIFTPLAVIALVEDDGSTLLNDRNISMILPFMALLMGIGITAFDGFGRKALIIFLLVNGLLTTDVEYTAPPWKPIAEYLDAHQVDQQPILYQVYGEAAAMNYHLREDVGKDIPLGSIFDLQHTPNVDLLTTLRFEIVDDATGFWLIYWGEDSPLFTAFQEWGYQRTYHTYLPHFENKIYLYRYDSNGLLAKNVTTFADSLGLHQVYIAPVVAADETFYVQLWWSAPQLLTQDYTVSVLALREDGTVAGQHDSFPQENQFPTSQWQPNQLVYDAHPLKLPAGTYQIGVKVYTLSDGRILPTSNGEEYQVVGTLKVE